MFDPYETLGLDKTFEIDPKILNQHYFKVLKSAHPDRFVGVDMSTKSEVLRRAGEANKAYGILKDPINRGMFLLKSAGEKPLSHDPVYLGEVMLWNEKLEEGEDIKKELHHEEKDLLESLTNAFQETDYKKAKIALYRLTYVRNLLITIGEKI